jgi:hypothetical protein
MESSLMKKNNRALDHLYHGIQERSPHLLYTLKIKDANGPEIQEYHDIKTFDDYVFTDIEKEILSDTFIADPRPVFFALRDITRGLLFLLKNNLILTDLYVDNIGIQADNKRGYLFDFDGLVHLNSKTNIYMAKEAYVVAPEFFNDRTYTEKSSVYEFGHTIQDIIRIHEKIEDSKKVIPSRCIKSLAILSNNMCAANPNDRPTLAEVEKELTRICDEFAL